MSFVLKWEESTIYHVICFKMRREYNLPCHLSENEKRVQFTSRLSWKWEESTIYHVICLKMRRREYNLQCHLFENEQRVQVTMSFVLKWKESTIYHVICFKMDRVQFTMQFIWKWDTGTNMLIDNDSCFVFSDVNKLNFNLVFYNNKNFSIC
jgi:hypothetical protein